MSARLFTFVRAVHEGKPLSLTVCSEQCRGVPGVLQRWALLRGRGRTDLSPQSHKPISAQINCLQQLDTFFHNETKHIYRAPSRRYRSEGSGTTCPLKVCAGSPGCSANRFVLSPSPRCSNYGSKKGLGKLISEKSNHLFPSC